MSVARRLEIVASLTGLLAVVGCADRVFTAPLGDRSVLRSVSVPVRCTADVRAVTLNCGGGPDAAGSGGPVVLGGHGIYMAVRSSSTSYDPGTGIFQADVTIQNLGAQPMGSLTGSDTAMTVVFFFSGPTANVGTATVANADTVGAFTGSGQSGFTYAAYIAPDSVSPAKTWRWQLAGGATSFTFSVMVSTDVPAQGGVLLWTPTILRDEGARRGVWVNTALDVWIVGDAGSAFRWDGTSWVDFATGTTSQLNAVWGSGVSNVFAGGAGGTIVRWDGRGWAATASGTANDINGIWGSSANNVFAVGAGGTIQHWTGSAWSAMASPTANAITAVWGTSSTSAWAVTAAGEVLRYTGSWAVDTTFAGAQLNGVWGSGPGDVYVVGSAGTKWHWDGTVWSSIPLTGGSINSLEAVWGTGAGDVWAVGSAEAQHWDGATWSRGGSSFGLDDDMLGAGGNAGGILYAVGQRGDVLTWDGATWTRVGGDSGFRIYSSDWRSASVPGANDVWIAASYESIAHFDGTSWTRWNLYDTLATLNAVIWASSPTDAWAGDDGGRIAHYNGTSWTKDTNMTPFAITDIWGSSSSDIWAASNDLAFGPGSPIPAPLHRTGGVWNTASINYSFIGHTITAIRGSGASDVWAVGPAGFALHYDGSAWAQVAGPGSPPDFISVVSFDSTDAWIGSTSGVWHYSGGGTWTQALAGQRINGVWGASSGAVYAVGNGGLLWLYDGANWTAQRPIGSANDLLAVAGSAAGDVWAVGRNGTVLHGTR